LTEDDRWSDRQTSQYAPVRWSMQLAIGSVGLRARNRYSGD
jgi:hypothetical protein